MAWTSSGSLAVTNGNVNVVGTSTLFLGAFSGDALIVKVGTAFYVLQIDSITDNSHLALAAADTYPGITGTIAEGDWEILPCSPLRSTTATITNQFANIIATYCSVLSLTASDNTVTLNKAASGNNAALILNTASVAMARIGCVGDNNLHLQVNLNGGGYSDVLLANQITGLCTVYADPTAALGIATKQYVDGTRLYHSVRLSVPVGTNVNISSPGASFDGVAAANGDEILLPSQTTPSQSGPWVFNGASAAMTRPAWFATGYALGGELFVVREGTANANKRFQLTTSAAITVGTTSLTITDTSSLLGTVQVNAGTAASPSLAVGESATGFYQPSAHQIGVSLNGALRGLFALNGAVATLTLGLSATAAGAVALCGSTSGTVTIQPGAAAAGTYNFNLPVTAGSASAPLLSGGGGSAAMTWGSVTGTGAFMLANAPAMTGLLDISNTAAGQIKFPATQNASSDPNTLDDLEKGTFTPGITLGGGSTGVTYATQNGSYTKIGNRVFFNIYVALSSKGSSSGSLVFTGLPFPSSNTFQKSVSTTAFTLLSTLASPPTSVVNANATTVSVLNWVSGSSSSLTNSQITDTSTFEISGHYDV